MTAALKTSARSAEPGRPVVRLVESGLRPGSLAPVDTRSPEGMATLLRAANPDRAAAFARATRDWLGWESDDAQAAFWRNVADLLVQDGPGARAAAGA